jgi:hypothetical protein
MSTRYGFVFFTFYCALFASMWTVQLSAAETTADRPHRLGIMGRALIYYGLDQIASPRAYRGVVGGGSLFYEYCGEKNHHMLILGGSAGHVRPKTRSQFGIQDADGELTVQTSDPFYVDAQMQYAYHRLLRHPTKPFNIGIGAALDADVRLLFFSYPVSWQGAYSLNISAMTVLNPKKRHAVILRLYLPFVTQLSRPAWTVLDADIIDRPKVLSLITGELTSVHKYLKITAEARYEFTISPCIKLGFIYEISYTHIAVPETADILLNRFSLGIIPTFSRRHQ